MLLIYNFSMDDSGSANEKCSWETQESKGQENAGAADCDVLALCFSLAYSLSLSLLKHTFPNNYGYISQ